jgi:hypothetical protein
MQLRMDGVKYKEYGGVTAHFISLALANLLHPAVYL